MRLRGAAVFALVLLTSALACNMIIGVEDVTLRGDGGSDEDVDVPVRDGDVPLPPDLFQIALGDQHTCAKKVGGAVRCWGDDTQGQTGVGTPTDGGRRLSPVDVPDLTDAIAISSGKQHSCAVRRSGTAACWGFDLDGQLGDGRTNAKSVTPVDVAGLTDARLVAAGGNFSCATRAIGRVSCWGGNASGQLGSGTTDGSATPVLVLDVSDPIAIAAGETHACAVNKAGEVFCWGEGRNGQLGTGVAASTPVPKLVLSIPPSQAVVAGERHACSLARTGAVHCWGANDSGQLGSGVVSNTPNATPIPVGGLGDATALATTKNHVCAVRRSGAVVCWGAGTFGQLGDGQSRTDAGPQSTFVIAIGVTGGDRAGAGGAHSCATTKAGGLFCWGANDRGQLGNGTTTSTLSPTAATGYP